MINSQTKTTYILPSSLLREAGAMTQPPEKVAVASGIKLYGVMGDVIIVITNVNLLPGIESRVHVEPDPVALLRIHKRYLAEGQDIEMILHSHPGHGRGATYPSQIDLETARRWEQEAPFLGAVFSEGARFVRFFNYRQSSEVQLYGYYLITEEADCFELPSLGNAEMCGQTDQPQGLAVDPPAAAFELVEAREDPPRSCAFGRRWRPGQ